jgi:hypothetical protein
MAVMVVKIVAVQPDGREALVEGALIQEVLRGAMVVMADSVPATTVAPAVLTVLRVRPGKGREVQVVAVVRWFVV